MGKNKNKKNKQLAQQVAAPVAPGKPKENLPANTPAPASNKSKGSQSKKKKQQQQQPKKEESEQPMPPAKKRKLENATAEPIKESEPASASSEEFDDEEDADYEAEAEETFDAVLAIAQELSELDAECQRESLRVLTEFERKKAPLFAKRRPLLQKLPDFWPKVLYQNSAMNALIAEEDQPLLEKLNDIYVERGEAASEYTLILGFEKNKILKTNPIKVTVRGDDDDNPIEVASIEFYPGKDFTGLWQQQQLDQSQDKGKKRKAPSSSQGSTNNYVGFFSYFKPTEDDHEDAIYFFNMLANNIFADAMDLFVEGFMANHSDGSDNEFDPMSMEAAELESADEDQSSESEGGEE